MKAKWKVPKDESPGNSPKNYFLREKFDQFYKKFFFFKLCNGHQRVFAKFKSSSCKKYCGSLLCERTRKKVMFCTNGKIINEIKKKNKKMKMMKKYNSFWVYAHKHTVCCAINCAGEKATKWRQLLKASVIKILRALTTSRKEAQEAMCVMRCERKIEHVSVCHFSVKCFLPLRIFIYLLWGRSLKLLFLDPTYFSIFSKWNLNKGRAVVGSTSLTASSTIIL